ncbi:MAG: hypothetical protein CMP42_01085 [Rickettsiales bacterium]|nr:hypothetical protein [Rickettsiales bacterium]|tara:strand:+ start:171 stop:449 length:279 start_codon:yes stop_codon:yes gene_type:complete
MDNSNSSSNFKKLVFFNQLVSFSLSFIILTLYFSFILIIGFYPNIFHIFIFKSSITFGIALGLFIILISIFLTLIYVIISNLFLDKLKEHNE